MYSMTINKSNLNVNLGFIMIAEILKEKKVKTVINDAVIQMTLLFSYE